MQVSDVKEQLKRMTKTAPIFVSVGGGRRSMVPAYDQGGIILFRATNDATIKAEELTAWFNYHAKDAMPVFIENSGSRFPASIQSVTAGLLVLVADETAEVQPPTGGGQTRPPTAPPPMPYGGRKYKPPAPWLQQMRAKMVQAVIDGTFRGALPPQFWYWDVTRRAVARGDLTPPPGTPGYGQVSARTDAGDDLVPELPDGTQIPWADVLTWWRLLLLITAQHKPTTIAISAGLVLFGVVVMWLVQYLLA